jgi:hypothetical protein
MGANQKRLDIQPDNHLELLFQFDNSTQHRLEAKFTVDWRIDQAESDRVPGPSRPSRSAY